MILQAEKSDLSECLDIIRKSFTTVADEFGLTEQNCPTNGAFMKIDRLERDFNDGNLMFCYYNSFGAVGFVQINKVSDDTFEMRKLAVVPECRHMGIGRELIDFVKAKVTEFGGRKITIGIIDEDTRLKDWYAENGFMPVSIQTFSHLPFTVGYMEFRLG
ncbi:MAG: hypothetical protein A2Y17_04655 [Clostridiales bacterium GWF2_38_85]|nr:MAG: hypothetical protein A2Y17_04655 [Clostridiales bacterium GWF2_38_85]HBL84422.1 GNAT family N-acetyltransferase [Clostridiales bacterium]